MMLRGEQVETLMVQWKDVCTNRLPKRSTNQCENQMDMKIAQAKQDRSQLSDAQLLIKQRDSLTKKHVIKQKSHGLLSHSKCRANLKVVLFLPRLLSMS